MFCRFASLGDQFIDQRHSRLDVAPKVSLSFLNALPPRGQAVSVLLSLEEDLSAGFHAEFPAHLGRNDNPAIFTQP
jgi:hypothetical protein